MDADGSGLHESAETLWIDSPRLRLLLFARERLGIPTWIAIPPLFPAVRPCDDAEGLPDRAPLIRAWDERWLRAWSDVVTGSASPHLDDEWLALVDRAGWTDWDAKAAAVATTSLVALRRSPIARLPGVRRVIALPYTAGFAEWIGPETLFCAAGAEDEEYVQDVMLMRLDL